MDGFESQIGISGAGCAPGPLDLAALRLSVGDERKEEKIDRILAAVDENAERVIRELDQKYPRK